MDKLKSKAQAAVEFLVTYGWAFIIILVVLGVLLYFGIINPNKFIRESCDFGPQLECIESQIGRDGNIVIKLQNNFADRINITSVDIYEYNLTGGINVDPITKSFVLSVGEQKILIVNVTDQFPPKEKVGIQMIIRFKRMSPFSNEFNVSGSLFNTVCDGNLNGEYIQNC